MIKPWTDGLGNWRRQEYKFTDVVTVKEERRVQHGLIHSLQGTGGVEQTWPQTGSLKVEDL